MCLKFKQKLPNQMQTIKQAMVIGNGIAGAENQTIGLLRALGFSNNYTLIRVNRPKGRILGKLLPVSVHKQFENTFSRINCFLRFRETNVVPCLERKSDDFIDVSKIDDRVVKVVKETIERDGPVLVVASGRDTISVASYVKQLAPESVFLVQIQHPRSRLHRFDLVITPRHDYYPLTPEAQKQIPWFLRRWVTPREPPDKHVVLTLGALHQADSVALRSAASIWHDEFAPLPKPLLVVSIGGPTRHCKYGVDLAEQLTSSLESVLPTCGSLRISFSRRTPKIVSDIIIHRFSNHPKVYIWNGKDPNPHMGHLAWADAFVITADSVSMLSEACSTGKPVYVTGAERCTWKFADFQRSLLARGAVRPFKSEVKISEKWSYSPLRDTEMAANEVIKALAERGLQLLPQ